MPQSKIFTVLLLCLVFVFASAASAIERTVNTDPITGERLVQYGNVTHSSATPSRDVDEFMTLRYAYSADGGATWSEVMGTGDHGMLDDDGESNWGGASYDFGSIVDNDNNLHFVVILNAYNEDAELNPSGRENGLYDVMANTDGEATYTMIIAEGDMDFYFSDCGMDADGNLYAVWLARNLDEDGAPVDAAIYAARTTDGAWGEPMMVVDGLDVSDNYPHITQMVGEYFYVVYEIPNVESGLFDHFVAKVPASFEGDVVISDPGIASGVYYSYYLGSSEPIAQDPNEGVVYITCRNEDQSAVTVANSTDGGETWSVESIATAQRYPSINVDPVEMLPWVFSNYGVPQEEEVHKNFTAFDELGYNGGSWIGPTDADELPFDGTKWLLYCHNGVWTPAGSFVRGCNAWGSFTPDGYVTSRWVDDAWSDPQFLWSIYDEGDTFVGGNITQNQLVAGTEDHVWVAFCGMYGESDFDPPECSIVGFSSVMLADDNVATALVTDATGVSYAMMNWAKVAEGYGWEWTDTPDSTIVDDDGNGNYYFTIPDSVTFAVNDSTYEMRALESGDTVLIMTDAVDLNGVYGAQEGVQTWIVDVGIDVVSISEREVLPFRFELGANYPNPFNNSTIIPFSLNRAADVNVSVFDVSGRLVANLFDGNAESGNHTVAWHGEGVSTGIYFYTLEANGVRHVAKMTLVR